MKDKKENIVFKCITNETKLFRTMITSIVITLLLLAIVFEIFRGGFALGLYNVKTEERLNKMVSKNKVMNIFPDSFTSLEIEVPISKTTTSGLSLLGSGEVQAPISSVETVTNYKVYQITLGHNAIYVLSDDIHFESDYKKKSAISVNIKACDSFSNDLIKVMRKYVPQEVSKYTKCYVAYGYKYSDHRLFYLIVLLICIVFIVTMRLINYIPIYQRKTKIGKQIHTLAKAKNITFAKMCNRINRSKDNLLYQNRDCIITMEYIIISSIGSKIRDMVSVILPVQSIQKMTILPGNYEDEFNEIEIASYDGKSYMITIYQSRDVVEEMIYQCLRYSGTK